MGRKGLPPGYAFLFGLGLFMILGHICALPAHAAGLDSVLGHTGAAHHGQAADESVHGGSCEAVRPVFAVQPPVVPVMTAVSVTVATRPVRPSPDRSLTPVAASPPLFLLHASLLI